MPRTDIQLSNWVRWEERSSLPGANQAGVYALAVFNSQPKCRTADPLDKNIVYFGETCNNTLCRRWCQFGRSAFQSKSGHSGGWTFAVCFPGRSAGLHVASLLLPKLNDELRPLYIRFAERKLIWNFACKHGKAPRCNRK